VCLVSTKLELTRLSRSMNKNIIKITVAAFVAFSSFSMSELIAPEANYGTIAKRLAYGLPRIHLNETQLDDSISEKTLGNYLTSLDFDHSFFLKSDIDGFQVKSLELDDDLIGGQLSFAYEVFDIFKERVQERVVFVEKQLSEGFEKERKEYFTWDRKEALWPETAEAQDDLWRKKIKNEYIGRIVAKQINLERPEEAVDSVDGEEDNQDSTVVIGSPEENILKKYTQFKKALEGHDAEWVLQLYLNSFTRSYDAHSSFMSPRAVEDFKIQMRLSLTGIGALLQTEEGAAKIVRLIPGGPAEQDGRLQPGDKIIAVAQGDDGTPEDILYLPLYKAVRLIRGEMGTKVKLSIIPASDKSGAVVKVVDIIRGKINLEEQSAKSEVREIPNFDKTENFKLGLITLPDFYADMDTKKTGEAPRRSSTDMRRLIEELCDLDVDGMIIDLRNNGGGALSDAIEIAGLFIEDGPVVQVKQSGRRKRPQYDPDPDVIYDGPLIIMVNRQSASASEIVAAALQDYRRAIIVGDSKTHGKGSVQSLIPIDGRDQSLGMMKLTTAGFYRIDGRSTQLKGVEPDIIIPSPYDYMKIGEEYLSNVLSWGWVTSANYRPFDGLEQIMPMIKERSLQRLVDNEDYKVYRSILDKIEVRNELEEYPLSYIERLEMAREDEKLAVLQKEHFGDPEELVMAKTEGDIVDAPEEELKEEAKAAKKDVVLDETLLILRDMVELEAAVKVSSVDR